MDNFPGLQRRVTLHVAIYASDTAVYGNPRCSGYFAFAINTIPKPSTSLSFLEPIASRHEVTTQDDYSTRGGSPAGLGISWSMVRGNPDGPQFCTLTDSRRYEARFHTQTRTRSAKIGGEVGFDSRVSEAIGRVAEQVRGARSQERLGDALSVIPPRNHQKSATGAVSAREWRTGRRQPETAKSRQ